jgi:hypothetical protein
VVCWHVGCARGQICSRIDHPATNPKANPKLREQLKKEYKKVEEQFQETFDGQKDYMRFLLS